MPLTIVGTMFSHQTLTALFLITCIQVVNGGGKLEVKFVRYVNPGGAGDNGNCCDGFSVCFSSCDHEFTLCIDDVSGPDSVSSCKYGVKRSGEISEANTIDFYNKVGIQDNPMVFTFNSWPGAVKVKVDVWDLDDSSSHDFVDFLSRLFASSPSPDVNRAKWYEFQLMRRTTLSTQIRVYCDTHYYGESCSESCIPSDNSETGYYYCDSMGNLVCKQNYFGIKCTRYCEPHNDSINGHNDCDVNTGDVVCLDGWQGTNCLEDIDECAVNNSTNNSTEHKETSDACSFQGKCTNLEGGFRCICEEQYTGQTCAEIKLYCSNTTCANNGTCMNTFGGYMCHCNDKWTGEHCEIELTPCTYYPCHNNGMCNIQGDSYNCTCDERFTGDHCEVEVTIPTSTTERIQVVSEDSIIVFLVGYLNDSDNNILIEGIKRMVLEYGDFNEHITLEIVKHKVTLKDGLELTQVEITAICTTANINGLLARIFRERAQEEIDRYLPLQLYNGKVDPYSTPQYQEKSWESQYWFVILIIILVVLAIAGAIVVFFFIRKRRHDTLKSKLAGDSSGVEEISPDTAIGFDNSLYFNVNQPERVTGLPGAAKREES